jgi:hypothetical protein
VRLAAYLSVCQVPLRAHHASRMPVYALFCGAYGLKIGATTTRHNTQHTIGYAGAQEGRASRGRGAVSDCSPCFLCLFSCGLTYSHSHMHMRRPGCGARGTRRRGSAAQQRHVHWFYIGHVPHIISSYIAQYGCAIINYQSLRKRWLRGMRPIAIVAYSIIDYSL